MTAMQDTALDRGAYWSVGGRFLETLANRDYARMATTLSPTVLFRAMLPPGPMEWRGPDAVTDAFRSWFGDAAEFDLADATVGEVGDRLHLAWRIHLRPAPFGIGEGWYTIEQQVYAVATETIQTLDLLCSGFQPQRQRSQAGREQGSHVFGREAPLLPGGEASVKIGGSVEAELAQGSGGQT